MAKTAKFQFILVTIFLIFQTALFSQRYPFRNYLERNGLPSSVVHSLCRDSRGYLWLGTDNGLSRFDGFDFVNFTKADQLPDNRINVMLQDRQGCLWIGTDSGVVKWKAGEGFIHPDFRSKFNKISFYAALQDRAGILWFGTSQGLVRYDGTEFLTPPNLEEPAKAVFSIVLGKGDKLYMSTADGLDCLDLGKINGSNWYKGKKRLLNDPAGALLYDSKDNLWVGTRNGLYCFTNGTFTTLKEKDGLSDNRVTALMEDGDGNIWVGTWNGVTLLSGKQISTLSTRNGLPHNFIYAVFSDQEGNIWFGTHGGAGCLSSLNIKTYTREDGLPDNILNAIIQDKKGRCWFATSEGVSCYADGVFKNFTIADGLNSNAVNGLMEDLHGRIWIATTQGLSVLDHHTGTATFTNYTQKDGLGSNIVFTTEQSRDGSIWIGHRNGLTHRHHDTFAPPPFDMNSSGVTTIMEDSKGNLWFASSGLFFYNPQKGLISLSQVHKLPEKGINAVYEDSKGRVWVGSDDGLICFYQDDVRRYTVRNSTLKENRCFSLVEDGSGKLWLGGSGGVSCFNGENFKTYSSTRLGLSGRSWLSALRDGDGRLWFGSTQGATVFQPPPVKINRYAPSIFLTSVKVMEEDVPIDKNGQFHYRSNIFRFDFIGISFNGPGSVRYKYLLENIDTDWKLTNERSLFYPFLPPGEYNLKVKTVNADGFESSLSASYRFKIFPPFWQTWWFLIFIALMAGVVLLLILQWRVKLARQKTELAARNRQLVISQRMELMGTLAAGTVHDLKNLLAVIIDYSREISQDYRREDENYRNIQIVKDTAATAVQMVKQILSFARPPNRPDDEPVELSMVLSEILDTLKVTQPRNIEIQWQAPAQMILFPIHPGRFQQLVMNLCINAFHAMPDGGKLTVELGIDATNKIRLQIADTGRIGISEENLKRIFDPLFSTKERGEGTGLGLFVVKQIVSEYGGIIDVKSEPGVGTEFIIRFPKTPGKQISTNQI